MRMWQLINNFYRRKFVKFYVVIYDFRDPHSDEDSEEYFGYFTSKTEAAERYTDLCGMDTRYHNAELCRILHRLPSPGDSKYG